MEMMPGDGDDRLAVELGVVEPVHKMQAARARRRQTDPQSAGELGIPAGHECRRLFMPHLHEANRVLPLAERLDDAVDSVARQTEDDLDSPLRQHVDQNVPAGACHDNSPFKLMVSVREPESMQGKNRTKAAG